jgi:hypothetical protein
MIDTKKGTKEIQIKEKPNPEGKFVAESYSNGIVGANISKEGYYDSYIEYRFQNKSDGRWLPWDPEITIMLNKIINPVPMYARHAEIIIPEINKKIGFDLIEYDWIKPYGKGKHADFVIEVTRKYSNKYEYNGILTVSTPNKFDGIQLVKENLRYGSMLKLPRLAPEDGYDNKIIKTMTATLMKSVASDSMEDNNYIFKIRSEHKDGKFHRAMYGKILGDFNFTVGSGTIARIGFKYYLNPDYTKNLEFDPKRNLFTNLKSTETVGLQ